MVGVQIYTRHVIIDGLHSERVVIGAEGRVNGGCPLPVQAYTGRVDGDIPAPGDGIYPPGQI